MVFLSERFVKGIALGYVGLPTVIFLSTWIRPLIGVPCAVMVVTALVWLFQRSGREDPDAFIPMLKPVDGIAIRNWMAFLAALLVLVWCVLAGQGGFVVQTWDWNFRNAVFRDLIVHDWPVVYDKGNLALSYYIGHWLPPALLGRMFYLLSGDLDLVWSLANVFLLLWTFCGVLIVVCLLWFAFDARTWQAQLLLLLLLVSFGGLSLVGKNILRVKQLLLGQEWKHHGTWAEIFQFSPNCTLLYWVFHQTVVPWILTLLLVMARNASGVVLLLSLGLLCGPMPTAGLAFLVGLVGVCSFVCISFAPNRRIAPVVWLRSCFSFPNLVGMAVVAPVVILYLAANSRAGSCSFAWGGCDYFWNRYLLFMFCEVGIYFVLTVKWRCCWWWAALAWLMICPLVKIGCGYDFCMRASIPALFVLMLIVAKAVTDSRWKWRWLLLTALLVGGLAPGAAGHLLFVGETFRCWPDVCREDRIWTLARPACEIRVVQRLDAFMQDGLINFLCYDPNESAFFKWLSAKH